MCSDMHVVRLVALDACLNLSHCAVESSRILCDGISASEKSNAAINIALFVI